MMNEDELAARLRVRENSGVVTSDQIARLLAIPTRQRRRRRVKRGAYLLLAASLIAASSWGVLKLGQTPEAPRPHLSTLAIFVTISSPQAPTTKFAFTIRTHSLEASQHSHILFLHEAELLLTKAVSCRGSDLRARLSNVRELSDPNQLPILLSANLTIGGERSTLYAKVNPTSAADSSLPRCSN